MKYPMVDTLNSMDIMGENPLPLFYQSGYLTIKDYDAEFKTYQLDFPREVRDGFVKYLVLFYLPKTNDKTSFDISNFVKEIRTGEAKGFMRRLEAFFVNGDYALMGDKELYFHKAMYVFFTLSNCSNLNCNSFDFGTEDLRLYPWPFILFPPSYVLRRTSFM